MTRESNPGPIRRPGIEEISPETQVEIASSFLDYAAVAAEHDTQRPKKPEHAEAFSFAHDGEAYLAVNAYIRIASSIPEATPLFVERSWERLHKLSLDMERLRQFPALSQHLRPKDRTLRQLKVADLRFLEPGALPNGKVVTGQSLCLNSLAYALEDGSLRLSNFNYRRRGASYWTQVLHRFTPPEF